MNGIDHQHDAVEQERPWIKAHDPKYGRAYYANLVTRATQWEVPEGWYETPEGEILPLQDEVSPSLQQQSIVPVPVAPRQAPVRTQVQATRPNHRHKASSNMGWGTASYSTTQAQAQNDSARRASTTSNNNEGSAPDYYQEKEPALPPGWEKIRDKGSGRDYYVDHRNKITQWTRPAGGGAGASHQEEKKTTSSSSSSISNGFGGGFVPSAAKKFGNSQSNNSSGGGGMEDSSSVVNRRSASTAPGQQSYNPRSRPYASHSQLQRSNSFRSTQSHDSNSNSSSTYHQFDSHSWRPSSSYSQLETLGEAPPEFVVRHVKDEERLDCPGCSLPFSAARRRRHHCRLCGDIFCDACSSHRCELPLDGVQFEKPVRVCDFCFTDVDKGNYFSMRRYLSTLQLFDPISAAPEENREAAGNVAGALSSLASDFDAVLMDSSSFEEKITISPEILIPAMARHLQHPVTSMYAIRAISTLLALGSVVGDNSFAYALFSWNGDVDTATTFFDALMTVLERNAGSSKQVLHAQEQAVRALFYLTESSIIDGVLQRQYQQQQLAIEDETEAELTGSNINDDDKSVASSVTMASRPATNSSSYASSFVSSFYVVKEDSEDAGADTFAANREALSNPIDSLDVHRALRNVLDHATSSASPPLQRWAVASVRHLVMEDRRRAEAGGDANDTNCSNDYKSFLPQFISTGAIMILCSLMSADDADTRSHATAALSSIIVSSRAIAVDHKTNNADADASIVQAIVENGGCGASLTAMMLSADESMAGMGCSFACLLVEPLLASNACGNGSDASNGSSNVAYAGAALALAGDDGCLPTLVDIARVRSTKSATMKRNAMVSLAAISIACHGAAGSDPGKLEISWSNIEREQVAEVVAFATLTSSSGSIQNSSGESAAAQIHECAAIILDSLCQFSPDAQRLMRQKNSVFEILSLCGDDDMMASSVLCQHRNYRGQSLLSCISRVMFELWAESERPDKETAGASITHYSASSSFALDYLLECLDAGVVPLLGRALTAPDGGILGDAKQLPFLVSACRLASAIFGIANNDQCLIARKRLYGAMETQSQMQQSSYAYGGGQHNNMRQQGSGGDSIDASAVNLMKHATRVAQQSFGGKDDRVLQELIENCCLALGSMCGAKMLYGNEECLVSSDFSRPAEEGCTPERKEFCRSMADLFLLNQGNALSAMVVGAFGEGCVNAALRLILAVAFFGDSVVIAQSGVLIPIIDMLKSSFAAGDRFRVSCCLALLRYGAGSVNADSRETTRLLASVRSSIDTVAGILVIPEDDKASSHYAVLKQLKDESIFSLEAMSTNSSMWQSITHCFEAISFYLACNISDESQDEASRTGVCSAIRTVRNVTKLPSTVVSAINGGLAATLSALVLKAHDVSEKGTGVSSSGMDVQLSALEVLCNLCSHKDSNQVNGSWRIEALKAAVSLMTTRCGAVSADAGESEVFRIGLEIIHSILDSASDTKLGAECITILCEKNGFARLLCAALMQDQRQEYQIKSHGKVSAGDNGNASTDKITGHQNLREAVLCIFMNMACLQYNGVAASTRGIFWAAVSEEMNKHLDEVDGALMQQRLLVLVQAEVSVPRCGRKLHFVTPDDLLQLRIRVINETSTVLEKCKKSGKSVATLLSYLQEQGAFKGYLEACKRYTSLVPSVCHLFGIVHEESPDTLVSLFREEGTLALLIDLFQTLQHSTSDAASSSDIICGIFFTIAEIGDLGRLVRKYGLRLDAISVLMATCPESEGAEEENSGGVDEAESGRINKILWCLISVLFPDLSFSALREGGDGVDIETPSLDPKEAVGIALSLGARIASLVVKQFQNIAEAESSDKNKILNSPEVILFCALLGADCLHLISTSSIIEAVKLLAAELNIAAVKALAELSRSEAALVLDKEGHKALFEALMSINETSGKENAQRLGKATELRCVCLQALTHLSSSSSNNRTAVAALPLCSEYVDIACEPMCAKITDEAEHEMTSSDIATNESIFRFLLEMVRARALRSKVLENKRFMEVCLSLLHDSSNLELSALSARFLKVAIPILSVESIDEESGSIYSLADVVCHVMSSSAFGQSSLSSESSESHGKIMWMCAVLDLLGCIPVPADERQLVLDNIVPLMDIVMGDEEGSNVDTDSLAFSIASFCFSRLEDKEWRDDMLSSKLVPFLVASIVRGSSSKLEVQWQAAATICLQCLSRLLRDGCGGKIEELLEPAISTKNGRKEGTADTTKIEELQLALERLQTDRSNRLSSLTAKECALWIGD